MSEKLGVEEIDHSPPLSGTDDANNGGIAVDKMTTAHTDPLQHVPSYSREGEELDPGYWRSTRFLGSILAIALLANSLFVGYSMPINILSVIDADIGIFFFLPAVASSSVC